MSKNHIDKIKNSVFVIIGSNGFIGAHVQKYLSEKKAVVVTLDAHPSKNKSSEHHCVDITHSENLKKVFSLLTERHKSKKFYVFHLAALIDIPASVRDPVSSYNTNIMGSVYVYESCRLLPQVEKIVVLSSKAVDSSYSPYAASKLCVEQISKSYCETFQLPISVVRLANVYGPGQKSNAVVPSILNQMITSDVVKVGDLNATRDFVFVEDVAKNLGDFAIAKGASGKTFLLQTGKQTSIRKLVALSKKVTKFKGELIADASRLRKDDALKKTSPSSKLDKLKLISQTPLEKGLSKMVDYIKADFHDKK